MSDQRPRCPHCTGLLKHEPADILGPERVKCILCGWELVRAKQPASRALPSPEPKPVKPAPVIKTMAEPKPARRPLKTGTCPLCQRSGLKLCHPGGICGRCAYRQENNIDLSLPNNKPGIRAPRTNEPAPTPTTHKKENTMGFYGTCTICGRTKISLQVKGKCARCNRRLKLGLDPLTGEKVAPAAAPAILADDEPISQETTIQATVGRPNIIGKLPASGFNLDVLEAIDEAWSTKRRAIIDQLLAVEKTSEKLRIAFHTLASVNAMGTEV